MNSLQRSSSCPDLVLLPTMVCSLPHVLRLGCSCAHSPRSAGLGREIIFTWLKFDGASKLAGRSRIAIATRFNGRRKRSAITAALQGDLCYPHLHEDDCRPRVLQVDGRDINRAFSLYRKRNYEYTALLFYVERCPFSRSTRQMFDLLSILFPAIHHIAVESSGLWPSELSEHGVRSLPALFVHNRTSRFQFHGLRSLQSVSQFYEEKTGFTHVPLSYSLKQVSTSPRKQASRERSWGNRFAKWLWDDLYLAFAVLFVVLRSFLYVQPKIAASLRRYWNLKGMSSKAQRRSPSRVTAEQRKKVARVAGKSKGKENGKGVLSVPSWPSSSLAAVALAECSARGVAAEDPTKKGSSVG
ncbi:hypothetical protein GOP47_0001523 [Adiantum capillus-veneris]|uniref:Thioredoxin domain-containing protein n=1 Tax=Adiantum capillus-veneris TaxID=13818 RepID=A0A9D4V8F0_ADICA|nr:hypothetical protein GOP47_0001523 [Adiantum capillus-veneris]